MQKMVGTRGVVKRWSDALARQGGAGSHVGGRTFEERLRGSLGGRERSWREELTGSVSDWQGSGACGGAPEKGEKEQWRENLLWVSSMGTGMAQRVQVRRRRQSGAVLGPASAPAGHGGASEAG